MSVQPQIGVCIRDAGESTRVQHLLSRAVYAYVMYRSVEERHSPGTTLRLMITDAPFPDYSDPDRHTLLITDRFDALDPGFIHNPRVHWIKRPFTDEELLTAIARILRYQKDASAHLRRKRRLGRMVRQLEALAVTDPLTGLYNLRYFQIQIQREVQRARRYSTPVSLLMFDLNHFKSINDQYGHPVGDQVLRRVGEIFRENLRTLDVAVRYGGDEFAVILPNTSKMSAVPAMQKLAERIASDPIHWIRPQRIYVSVGMAESPADTLGETELVRLADEDLYRNKQRRIKSLS